MGMCLIVYYTFHSVVEYKFLAYVLNVNMFCYAYHFIHKCCVFHMHVTIALFAVSKESSVVRS
jgi:hypothetical protein